VRTKLSSLPVAILGRLTGVITLQQRWQPGLRRRVGPKTPTPCQAEWQRAFKAADAAWPYISASQHLAWNRWRYWYAAYGYSMFMRVNIPRAQQGLPLLLDPPDYPPWV
jgi:hypothetical protein